MAFLRSTMSLLGLYEYDNTIFDDFTVPDGMDKGVLTGNILVELAELEVVYPNPVVMKTAIRLWSNSCLRVWQQLFDTTQYDYNPLINSDRDTIYTESVTRDTKRDNVETRDIGTAGTGQNVANGSDTQSVSGYNSDDFTNAEKSVTQQDVNTTSETTENGTVSNDGSEKETVTRQWGEHQEGTIGVITTQDMIEKQRNVVKFNIYDYILTDFKNRFCILVY